MRRVTPPIRNQAREAGKVIEFIVHIVVSAALLFVLGSMVDGIEVRDSKAALFGALGLGFANGFVRPILLALTLPITFVTLGLFVWVVNALMLMLAASFVDGFKVEGFKSALWGSLVLGFMNFLVGLMF
jgi:putative membrane protein